MDAECRKGGFAVERRQTLDAVRGCALASMILYHAAWDLVYIFGADWPWYRGMGAYVWQQSICWTFILLSGYCWSLGRRQLRRGLTVFACGALVTAATWLFMPGNLVQFGVLTLLGSASILLWGLAPLLSRLPARGDWRGAFHCSCSSGMSTAAVWALRGCGCSACRKGCTGTASPPSWDFPRRTSFPRTTFPCCRGCSSS